MDSSRIAALGSPKPPTIASRRPMLSSQRSLSALSINTNTTHGDMMRRNSSATTANRHRRLQTPNNVPPLPLSAASNASLSPEELSSKIADSFQQFSSMLSQLSNNKTATTTNNATPVTPPSSSNYPAYILSPQKQQLSPRHTIPSQAPQRSNLLNSPPLSSLPSTATQNIHRKEVRLSSQPASVVIQPRVPSSVNPTQLQSQLPSSPAAKKAIEPKEEEEKEQEIDMEAYYSHAIYFKTALDDITVAPTISQGNTELRRRLISKWLTRAASIGDLETMQQMLESVQDIDVNCTDDKKTGMTSLMYASYFGHLQCLDLLLSQPLIKINQQDKKGWTALMWAINSYQTEIVQKLLSQGAKKTLQTRHGRSIYSYPTSDTVKELLGTPPITKPTQMISAEKTTTQHTAENSRRRSNGNSEIEHFYQTSVDGYSHFLKNAHSPAADPRRKSAPVPNPLSPPDFSQLTKAITTPQQEQRNKESALHTLTAAEDVMDEEDMKRWETSIKSSNTFSWNQCLPDQMFVFSQEDLSFIVEQALTVTDIKLLMNKTQLSNELWQPANIIFLSARFAYYCSSRELLNLLLRTAAGKLSKIIKNAYRDTQSLAYWIANMCQLSSYLKKDPGLSISTHESQETLSELIAEAYAFFVTESQKKLEKILDASVLDYESIQEVEQVDFVDDWQRFFRRSNGSRRSTDTISSVERKSSMDFSSSQTNIDSFSPQSITKLLTQIQSTLQAYHVPPAIVIQAMAQFFHYLSCELFNRVLAYKKYLCRSKALQLRMNLSGIEEWVRASHLPASLFSAFEPLIQLLQLLQCLSQMNDIVLFSSTIQTFDKLNPLQVKRCVQTYRYEVSEVKLPESVEQLANQMAFDHQQQLVMVSNSRRNSSSSSSSSGMAQRSASIDLSSSNSNLPTGRPTSISSLNCLLTTTTNKKRLSSEEMLSLNSTMVQQLDDVDDLHDEGEEKRNSKYLLPFSIPVTTALLQGWTDEKQKNATHHTTNYSDGIYQEIKRKKQEQFNLLDKIYPVINEEWVFNLDKRLHVR